MSFSLFTLLRYQFPASSVVLFLLQQIQCKINLVYFSFIAHEKKRKPQDCNPALRAFIDETEVMFHVGIVPQHGK